jgi:hypothetical protein
MFHFVYTIEGGALWSWTREAEALAPPEALAAHGRAVIAIPDDQVPQPWVWDAGLLQPVAAPPKPVLIEPDELIACFSPTEWAAGLASPHPGIIWFISQITSRRQPIDLSSERIAQGLALAASEGVAIIGADRVPEILSGQMWTP